MGHSALQGQRFQRIMLRTVYSKTYISSAQVVIQQRAMERIMSGQRCRREIYGALHGGGGSVGYIRDEYGDRANGCSSVAVRSGEEGENSA